MSGKKKKEVKKEKKVDKYDITVSLDCTFEEAMKKIATDANLKLKQGFKTAY